MDAPTLITGDMDSITEETKAYFQDVASVTDLDQDSTDFQKSLSNLKDERPIVVLGELGGRFDHSLHALSVLFEPQNLTKQIFIYNGKNLAFAINEGITTINLINRQV